MCSFLKEMGGVGKKRLLVFSFFKISVFSFLKISVFSFLKISVFTADP